MNRLLATGIFLVINFGGLYLGNILMDNGPRTDWYLNLNKAPWTPPGWLFGVAWTFIMICFSIYLTFLFQKINSNYVKILFSIQFLLNVSWNYIFFNQHLTNFGLLVILLLTVVVFIFFFNFKSGNLKKIRLLLLPYLIWLCIATSLNAYVVLNN